MSKRRNKYPNEMQLLSARRPSPKLTLHPDRGRIANHQTLQAAKPRGAGDGTDPDDVMVYLLPAVERECAYCGQEKSRRELTKLPNKLFICGDHPPGDLRDRRSNREPRAKSDLLWTPGEE